MNVWTSAIRPLGADLWLWAQAVDPSAVDPAAASGGTASGGAAAPVVSTLVLAVRRWCSSVTLAPQGTTANASPYIAWGAALGLMLLIVIVLQGPARALGQFLDIPGQLRLLQSASLRFRRSGRVLAILLGTAVIAWTATQGVRFRDPGGRDDVVQLTKGRQLGELAFAHGALAGLTPLRDLAALGLMFPLLIAATTVLFQYATDRWMTPVRLSPYLRTRLSRWSSVGWIGASLYALYRLISMASGSGDLPMSGCIYIEALAIPPLMAISDGVLLAWVVVELRNAGLGDTDDDSFDVRGMINLIPGAILACVLILPSRYLSAAVILVWSYVPPTYAVGQPAAWVRWGLGWGVIGLQVLAFPFLGMAGAIAWTRGTVADAFSATGRLLKAEGGRLLGAVALSGALSFGLASAAYLVVLALPAQSWVLLSADSYAHYATMLVGLLLLSGMIDLAERTLPVAGVAREPEIRYAEEPAGVANGLRASRSDGEEIVIL